MDKTYRKSVIGMVIPTVLATIIIIGMTLAQKSIIRSVMRSIMNDRSLRQIMYASFDLTHAGTGTVAPYYMFFCVLMAFVVIVATIIVVSGERFKAKPKMAVLLFVLYGITPVLGSVYNAAGGDVLLNDPKLATNISILSTVISLVVSPVMVIMFVFFLITVIKFIKNAKKAQRESVSEKKTDSMKQNREDILKQSVDEFQQLRADPVRYNDYLRSEWAKVSPENKELVFSLIQNSRNVDAIKELHLRTRIGLQIAKDIVTKLANGDTDIL